MSRCARASQTEGEDAVKVAWPSPPPISRERHDLTKTQSFLGSMVTWAPGSRLSHDIEDAACMSSRCQIERRIERSTTMIWLPHLVRSTWAPCHRFGGAMLGSCRSVRADADRRLPATTYPVVRSHHQHSPTFHLPVVFQSDCPVLRRNTLYLNSSGRCKNGRTKHVFHY